MREQKISLLENVKIDKVRKATEEEKANYFAKKVARAKEEGKELNPNLSYGDYIVQATQSYVRDKDDRLIHAPLDIRTDIKFQEGKTYTIMASWLVLVQGVHLMKADHANLEETKKDEK